MMVPLICGTFFSFFGFILTIFITGEMMTRRRPPDPADNPANYGLPYEEVSFPSRYKAQIRGWWIPAEQPIGTVIFCHGQNGSMDGDLPQAVPFYHAGYNILMFNFRAHGNSDGKTVTFGVFEKEDLLGAVDFLADEKGIQNSAVVGFSMGTAVAMIGTALTDKISVLILDGAFWRLLDLLDYWMQSRHIPPLLSAWAAKLAVTGASFRTNTRMFQISPRLWAKHLNQIPVLFIHGEKDKLIPLAEVQKLAADLNGPHKIWVAPDCDHREAFKKYEAEYNRLVFSWLKEHYHA
ncbi:MAG: alpha/beta hydrolase [Anaerolineae bacterium]|nr:alpha/beta hydrolase [Anaerolineae bacterium]